MTNPFGAQFSQQPPAQNPAAMPPNMQQAQQVAPQFSGAPSQSQSAPQAQPTGDFAAPKGAPAGNLSDMFSSGAAMGAQARIADDLGALVCIRPIEFKEGVKTSMGVSDAILADWLVVTGPNAGQIRENALIFNGVVVSGIATAMRKGFKFVAGRVAYGEPKNPSHNKPILIDAPTEAELQQIQAATQQVGWV